MVSHRKSLIMQHNEEGSLKKKISQILVKWEMPTRQVAINEILELISSAYTRGKKEGRKDVLITMLNQWKKQPINFIQEIQLKYIKAFAEENNIN